MFNYDILIPFWERNPFSLQTYHSTLYHWFQAHWSINLDKKNVIDDYGFLKQLLMISHPQFTDTASGLNFIPQCSKYSDLHLYARTIQEYTDIQRINRRIYTVKRFLNFF